MTIKIRASRHVHMVDTKMHATCSVPAQQKNPLTPENEVHSITHGLPLSQHQPRPRQSVPVVQVWDSSKLV